VIPAIVLAAITPHLVAMVRQYDLALLVPLAAHTAADTRALDLLNALLFLAPVAVVFLPLGLAVEPRAWWSAEGAFFAALVVPFLAIAAWFYPPEGLFRYWDILAPTGIALSLTGAWTAARIVAASNRWRWLWVSCSIAAACPALLIMVHDANTESGLKRVQAFLDEPPARSPQMRASAWEFMGFRLIDLGRAAEAAEAFAHAADVVPSPRVLRQWAVAETMAGDPVAAQSVLRRIVDRDPGNRSAWQALAAQSIQNGDSTESVRALKALIRLSPGDPEPRNALRRIAPDRAGRPH
jgi:cytochrome c-type biogenesis protein CcmH/NrfG